jgi:outer membrane protein OmpA-like peptidoglycan-associated protein
MDFLERVGSPRVRRAAAIVGALLALWALAGFLVLPALLRPVVERKIGEALHRKTTLKGLSLNPFALSVTLNGLDVKDRDGTSPFISFESLYVNAEAVSIFRGGPVLSAITLVKPSVSLVRNLDGTYGVQDLVEQFSKPRPKDDKPLRFALNNIRLLDGRIDFDDRPKRTKHTVRDLEIGIPFLSNIPSKVQITTQPVFRAKVNGAPFDLAGRTKPFSETRETTLHLNLSDVDIPFYLAYVPVDIPSKVMSARLDAKLVLTFRQPLDAPPALVVSGTAALRKVAVEQGGEPLLAWERFDADAEAIDVFGRSAKLRSLKLTGPELWVRRHTMAEHDIANALAAPGKTKTPSKGEEGRAAPARPPEAAKPFSVQVAEAAITGGKVHYDDFAFHPAFHALLSELAVSLKGFTTQPGKPATLEASARSDAGEAFRNSGTLSMDPGTLAVAGTFSVDGVPLKRYATYLDEFVPVAIDGGVLALKTGYTFSTGKDANTTLSDLSVTVTSPRFRKKAAQEPFFKAATLAMSGSSLDLARHAFVLGNFTGRSGFLSVIREKDGNADLMELAPKPKPGEPPPPPSAPWDVTLRRIDLEGWTVKMDDRSWDHPARYSLTKTDVLLENLSTAKGSKGSLAAKFGVNGKGTASARGGVGFSPIFSDLKIDVKGVDLVPLEAYVLPNLHLELAKGVVNAGGTLALHEDAGGKASVVWAGNALVANVLAVDESTKLDFLKWESFSATGMKAGYNPLFLEVKQLAAVGLECDVTIEADGNVNLRKVVGAPAPKDDDGETAATPPDVKPAPAVVAPATPAAKDARLSMPIRIDELTLQDGRIGLADHFVKPNYAATLGNLGGRVTGLSSEEGTVATIDLRGSLGNHSPLQVSGRINPLAVATFADVKASFRDIDLPAFTPYSGTYAGYTIASGSLTMEVAYKVENRKLNASNRFLVNQFEFGEKVESKQATKLPVRLAVSLLKDKDGVIDLDLPIEGSLDDPKFRIGKVVWQVLGNLIAKAATAPFALLGKMFGGKGDELSTVDFPDGLATLDEAAKKKLDALAKALAERPALKLQATGRFSGADLEGLRTARVERKIKAQKLPDLVKAGTAPASVDDVVVTAEERETYLKKAYKKEKFPKPRTALGFAKDLPAPEMEKLMLANEAVGDDDLRQLALARANAVKDYLVGPAGADASRVFVLEPGAQPAAPKDKARASRVDFTLK